MAYTPIYDFEAPSKHILEMLFTNNANVIHEMLFEFSGTNCRCSSIVACDSVIATCEYEHRIEHSYYRLTDSLSAEI